MRTLGALRLAAHGLVPGVGEERGFGLAADQFLRGVFDDAGDIDLRFLGGRRSIEGQRGSLSTRLGLEGTDRPRLDARLRQQEVVKPLIGALGAQSVVRAGTQRVGDPILDSGAQEGGHQLHGPAATVVHLLGDERALPIHALALAGRLVPAEAAVVGLRTDDDDRVGGVEPVHHPTRPAFRRRAVHILVEDRLDAVRAQAFGEREHLFAVLFGIVAVADEDRFLAHVMKTRVESSTAAKHGTEKSRAEAQARRRFSTAPSSESFGREGRKDKG